jgi:hypothetical protein
MKRAFFVIGPESSGTRMMTRAFIKCGAYGSGGHLQILDEEGFKGGHEMIVFRRSVPHGKFMPKLSRLVGRMTKNNYVITPIVILRDKDACAASQVKNKHAKNLEESRLSIEEAVNHIYSELSSVELHPIIIHYEPFVKNQDVRKAFFTSLGLSVPQMEFYDGNEQYKENNESD